jgi:Mce-associated membrane protein
MSIDMVKEAELAAREEMEDKEEDAERGDKDDGDKDRGDKDRGDKDRGATNEADDGTAIEGNAVDDSAVDETEEGVVQDAADDNDTVGHVRKDAINDDINDVKKKAKKDAKKAAKRDAKRDAKKAAGEDATQAAVKQAAIKGDADLDSDVDVDLNADVRDSDVEESSEKAGTSRVSKLRERPKLWRWVAAVLVGAAIGGGVFGYMKYSQLNHELTALRQTQSDRDVAAKLAKEYALKSLNYTFEDPDAFFRSVESGVSQSLKDKYVNATTILKGVMVQAQVTSTGEVLAVDAVAQPGDVYQVVVSAAQTTRNLQSPKPRVSLILLQITVNKTSGGWQVSDIGPKTGSHAASTDQFGPPAPPPAPEAPPAPRR